MGSENAKKAAGKAAINFVKEGMLVGIGTGSTIKYFIDELIVKVQKGLNIQAVFSSEESKTKALEGGIQAADINSIDVIDLTVDGADEINDKFEMIKGGGGALFREKILATASKHMVVIVDESKVVSDLGARKLPIEILPFGINLTLNHLKQLSLKGDFRKQSGGSFYVTDNGNYIIDLDLEKPLTDPKVLHQKLSSLAGIVETGLFFEVAKTCLIGYESGEVKKKVC